MSNYPAAIEAVLAAGRRAGEPDPSRAVQTTTIIYEHNGDEIYLAMLHGPLPVPAPGQHITVHTLAHPLTVDRVETHFGLSGESSHASVRIYVTP
ncbi:hypothetical protein ACH43Y_28760 [Streptomyces rubiginosohelvolus]|uniref:hypothetical protein n=1 Tax=Streptomyces rubiginosohelvolus TaxID=67362 RepID=UPI00378FB2D4